MFKLEGELAALVKSGLTRSVASLLIKVVTAGLTYVGFVVLARTMTSTEYGYFAFGLALATLLSIGAGAGQQTAILRFWSEDMANKRPDRALGALRAGGTITVLGSLLIGGGLALVAPVVAGVSGQSGWHLYAAAILILPMALAEYNSAALRAQGSIWTALVPRDILWRIALPAAAAILFLAGAVLAGWSALLLAATLLMLMLAAQYGLAARRNYHIMPGGDVRGYWRERGGVSCWFLLGGFINAAALNADTIVVGAMVDPASAGAYFNAVRTGGLMTLFSFAISLVIAPHIAQHFFAGELRKAQAILAGSTWAGFLFSLAVFVVLVPFSAQIMGLFGPDYEAAAALLIVLALGLLVDAATGPSRTVLMMTGHERSYALIFGVSTVPGIVAQIAVVPAFGLMGVAVVSTLSRVIAYGVLSRFCITKAGLDPTIFGILQFLPGRQMPTAPTMRGLPK